MLNFRRCDVEEFEAVLVYSSNVCTYYLTVYYPGQYIKEVAPKKADNIGDIITAIDESIPGHYKLALEVLLSLQYQGAYL